MPKSDDQKGQESGKREHGEIEPYESERNKFAQRRSRATWGHNCNEIGTEEVAEFSEKLKKAWRVNWERETTYGKIRREFMRYRLLGDCKKS